MSDEPSHPPTRSRTTTTRSAMRQGEGSFRGLLSGFSRTVDKSASSAVPPSRDLDPQSFLRDEMQAAREAVKQLDAAVSTAVSFREAAMKLLTEAHKALGRLEQAVANKEAAADLIGVACDIKCAAKRGITLVDVHGKYSTVVKIVTLALRSYIHGKFDKQTELLRKLHPPQPHRGVVVTGGNVPPPQAQSQHQQQHPTTQQLQQQQQQQQGAGAGCAMVNAASMTSTLSGGSMAQSPAADPAALAPAMAGQPTGSVVSNKPLGRASLGPAPATTAAAAPSPAASGMLGKALPSVRHEKVLALAFVPAAAQLSGPGPSDKVCIWWSAGQRLEFYADVTQATTTFRRAVSVTALAVDEAGGVWTGHIKGQVRVWVKQQQEEVEVKEFSAAIRVIWIDEAGRAWVGDEAGRIKVLAYSGAASDGSARPGGGGGQLETLASLQRSPALLAKRKCPPSGSLFGKRYGGNSGGAGQASAATVFAAATAAANTVAAAAVTQATAAAATAGRDGSPGGAAASSIAAGAGVGGGDSGKAGPSHLQPGTMEGPVRCIFVRGNRAWASGGRSPCAWLQLWDAQTFQDIDVFDCGAFGPCHAMAPLRWPSAGSSYHPTLAAGGGGLHRHTQSDGLRAGGGGGAAAGSYGSGGPSWRLLTGHENGQLLLWHPEHRTLAPLLRIGEPGSPCRGIAAFEAYNLVVTGHQGGILHLFVQPGVETGLPPGSESATPQSLGTHRPKMATLTAHKSRLERMAYGPAACVTSSILGTIRLWHAADLAQEAHRMGLTLAHTHSYSSLLGVDLSQAGTSLFLSNTNSQFTRDSAKGSLGELPLHASGQLASPPAGGGSYHLHRRQGSKDSIQCDVAASAQPGSGTTTATGSITADTLGAVTSQASAPPSATSFPHFQTIEFSELRTIKTIGSGAYGEVLLADWLGSEVAVKRLFAVPTADSKEYDSLMNEVTLLGSLSHPNIVRFLAMCTDPPCIVMQYYSHGSLFNMLRNAAKGRAAKEMTWSKRLEMLRDVAAGMQYLHSRKPPVIHGDLRSPNLLLDLTIERERPRFHVKIADFGLARMAPGATGSVMVSKMTNPRWLAPEVMKNSSVGKAADVYSFAIIMWEMLTWQQPYQDMMSVQVIYSMANDGGARPDVPPDEELPGSPGESLPAYRQLMERCWQADAAERPSFKEIVEVFQEMLRVEAEAARLRRPQQQQQQQHPQQPHVTGLPRPPAPMQQQLAPPRSGSASDAGGQAPSPPAGDAAGTGSAPGSGGSEAAAAAAAVAAAARRAASAGVTSPFMVPQSPAALGDPQAEQGAATTPDGGGQALGQQQYGSVLPLYGMSPILEETSSVSAAQLSVGSAATPTPAAEVRVAHALQQQDHHHASQPQPHVHFAITSPFSQSAAEGAPAPALLASVSCPASPAVSSHPRGTAAAGASAAAARGVAGSYPMPLSPRSSAESGAVHAASGGSNILGAPSTASSSRQSSTSTSGRILGAAAAAVASTATAAPGLPGGSATQGRVAGAAASPAGVSARPAEAIGAHDDAGEGAAAAGSGVSVSGMTPAPAASMPLWATHSTPTAVASTLSSLSPFASMPAAQLGELDAAAPQLAALNGLGSPTATTTTAGGHTRGAAALPSPMHFGTPRGAGAAGGRGAGAGAAARSHGHTASTHPPSPAAAAATGARGRIPGPSVGNGQTVKAGGGGTPSSTPRSGGGASQSQPGTPPYRGPAAASPVGRGAVGHGSRPGSVAGAAAASGGGVPGHSYGGEGPVSGGSRLPGSGSASSTPCGDGTLRPVSVSTHQHLSEAAARLSRSAAHAHIGGHDDAAASPAGRPGHRRTPSGGNLPGGHHHHHPHTGAANRARDLLASAAAAAPYSHGDAAAAGAHPRTPLYPVRSGDAASPRMSAPNATPPAAEPRAVPAGRRNASGLAGGAADAVGSPSAPSSGQLSRLAAAAAARPPASPRSYIPGGPGATSAPVPQYGAATHAASGGAGAASGGASRIPSLAQAAASSHGSAVLVPTKSATSRSLDDGSLRRLGLSHEPSTSPPMTSALASPAVGGPPAADTADAGPAWEEGLDGDRHSPDVMHGGPTGCVRQAGDDGRPGAGAGDDASYTMPPSLPRIATSGRGSSSQEPAAAAAAAADWQQPAPPPSLAAARAGGVGTAGPFAAAAYAGPFFTDDREGGGEVGGELAAEASTVHLQGWKQDGLPGTMGSSGVRVAATSPTAAAAGPQMASAWDGGSTAALTTAAAAAPTAAVPAPGVRVAATAGGVQSPFAQVAGEQDSWWEHDQRDRDD